MVSRKQSFLISLALATTAAFGDDANTAPARPSIAAAKRKFLKDDPIWKEPKPRPVEKVKPVEIDNLYDFLRQSFVVPREQQKLLKSGKSAALNANTLGEVPDSEWYTNRHARRPMSIEQLKRGPGNADPPSPTGNWRVISAKSDGVTPGFTIEDSRGNRYLLKFDPPNYPELASASDVIGSKMYYALGYNTPENYVAYLRPDQLTITESSSYKDALGKKRLLTRHVVETWLAEQPKDSQGRYRVLASRLIPGKPAGPFSFEGTRADDPNDIVRHEYRRELRGMAVFASWLNDTDAKSINTFDTLIEEGGVSFVKHYRIDWGASLGSDSLEPKDIRRGHDYFADRGPTAFEAATFGFYLPKWMRASYPSIRGVGTLNSESFDAAKWVPNYPVSSFLLMDDQDAFWAAKQVMAFSDQEIRALVETGQYSDPRATDWVTECLIKRRDKIGKAWLSRGMALDNFRVQNARLQFDDLAQKYKIAPERSYAVSWSTFDNSNGEKLSLAPPVSSWTVPGSAGERTGFLTAEIRPASSGGSDAGTTVYLRRTANGWDVIGIDRR